MFYFVILAITITNAMEIMSVYHMNPESAGAIPVNMDTGDVRFRFQKNIFFVRNLESHTYVFVSHKKCCFVRTTNSFGPQITHIYRRWETCISILEIFYFRWNALTIPKVSIAIIRRERVAILWSQRSILT